MAHQGRKSGVCYPLPPPFRNTRKKHQKWSQKKTHEVGQRACSAKSNKIQDQVFWYKADDHNDFRLGSKEFWELSKQINDDDDDGYQYDPNNVKKRGQGPKISVKKSKW